MALTKTQVNNAGKRLAKFRESAVQGADIPDSDFEGLLDAIATVDEFRAIHAGPLRATNANLRWYVSEHGRVSVTQRLKKLPTVVDKLNRQPTMKLANMEDIGGVRAVLPDQRAVDEVSRRLKKNWTIKRARDYVRSPKASGYRAIHLVAVKQGVCIEVQLRTFMQDVWANQVEHDSRHLRTDFKSGRGAAEVHDYYVVVSELFALRERDDVPSDDFLRELGLRYARAKPFLASSQGSQ